MDLVKEFKIAVKNPVNFKNLFIIFFNFFLILILGLSMLAIIKYFVGSPSVRTACTTPRSMAVNDSANANKDIVYNINFSGNDKCFIESWFTWADTNKDLSLWVYEPSGNVSVIDSTKDQPNLTFITKSPPAQGSWRLIIKTKSTTPIPFSGEVAIH